MREHSRGAAEVVDEYLDAYNRFDLDRLAALIDEDIVLVHHNRAIASRGRLATLDRYRVTHTLLPDRRFTGPRVVTVVGDRVFVEHHFVGTFTADSADGRRGERLELDLLTVFRIAGDRIVEYDDYG